MEWIIKLNGMSKMEPIRQMKLAMPYEHAHKNAKTPNNKEKRKEKKNDRTKKK